MKTGFIVPARSRDAIYGIAGAVRGRFAPLMRGSDCVPIAEIFEILPEVLPGFRLEVCEYSELRDDHGQTFPDDRLIKLREDVYDGMHRRRGRDRFTAAHELGHLFLHGGIGFARRPSTPDIKRYLDSEWQADTFASAFLIDPARVNKYATAMQVSEAFGVSLEAAQVRFKK